MRTELPAACGPLSETIRSTLTTHRGRRQVPRPSEVEAVADPLDDRDFQLALWMLYELHHRGFDGVDDALEWDPVVLHGRRVLESALERELRDRTTLPDPVPTTADEVVRALIRLTTDASEPALPAFLAREATEAQFRTYLVERAVYHLREADAQCFLLARLSGPAKVALAEIQYDELGAGRPDRLHADLYGTALADLGLSTDVGVHVASTSGPMLAVATTASFLNLHRRLRGAAAGHFAAFEATSSVPCRLVAEGAERLGLPASVAGYYREHVEADAVHEQVAITGLCHALAAEEPELVPDILLGAQICLLVDGLAAAAVEERLRGDPAERWVS